ncbi:MAG TPA: hypothetical protein PLZ68_17225 [Ferruginibacter sp.]|nr:hypothetical protein [Ferruginibacter sp.]
MILIIALSIALFSCGDNTNGNGSTGNGSGSGLMNKIISVSTWQLVIKVQRYAPAINSQDL